MYNYLKKKFNLNIIALNENLYIYEKIITLESFVNFV